jgi:hypothetical protein
MTFGISPCMNRSGGSSLEREYPGAREEGVLGNEQAAERRRDR